MKRILTILATLAISTTALAEQPSSDAYDLQVVLRFGAHNWLGQQFRDGVRDSLAGMLTDGLGAMGNVNVVNLRSTPAETWPELWKKVDAKGLGALDPEDTGSQKKKALEVSGGKTHFVLIDYLDGFYDIQSRQHDGQTGFVSTWRHERTADRAFVARIAGKLIAEDFGAVGTLASRGDKDDKLRVAFKGGAQGAPLERFAQRGDIFALVQIVPAPKAEGTGPKELAFPVDDTYLQLTDDPKGGECAARLVYRAAKNPLVDAPKRDSFRCIRLGTTQGPIRVRLVDADGQPLRNVTLQLWVHSEAFQNGPQHDEESVNADRNGMFISSRSYDRMAFARVIAGGNSVARVPVPIEDRDVTVKMGLKPDQSRAGDLQAIADDLYRQYQDVDNVHVQKIRRLNEMTTKGLNKEAKEGYENARADIRTSLDRLKDFSKEVLQKLAGSGLGIANSESLEKRLEDRYQRYNRMIGQLGNLIREENAPDKQEKRVRLEALNVKILAAIQNDDYDEALVLLNKAVEENPDRKDLKQERDKLKDEWQIKDEPHHQARDFAYKEWPNLKTSEEIEAKLPAARKHLAVCIKYGDYLTVMKLRNSLSEIGNHLRTEVNGVATGDVAKITKLKKIVEDFQKFSDEIEQAIQSRASK